MYETRITLDQDALIFVTKANVNHKGPLQGMMVKFWGYLKVAVKKNIIEDMDLEIFCSRMATATETLGEYLMRMSTPQENWSTMTTTVKSGETGGIMITGVGAKLSPNELVSVTFVHQGRTWVIGENGTTEV